MSNNRKARLVRRALCRLFLGRGSWPVKFSRPSDWEQFQPPVSGNLYFHIPFCANICPHCPYLKFPHSHQHARAYQIALLRDFKIYLAHQGVLPIRSLYFGGGTPSLCPELIEEVLGLAAPELADDAEIGIELHPQDCGEPSQEMYLRNWPTPVIRLLKFTPVA